MGYNVECIHCGLLKKLSHYSKIFLVYLDVSRSFVKKSVP